MNAPFVDLAAVRAVSPTSLSAYVRAEGWAKQERFGEHSDVYARDRAPELIIPGTTKLGDYPEVVFAIIRTLAKFEGRTEAQVFKDLSVSDRDVVRIRAPEALDDGSLQVDAGVNIFAFGRDLLLSAACSAIEPRTVFRAGKNKDAVEYMNRVRLGQTEQGSFIVTLLAPVPPLLEPAQTALWPVPAEEPYDRMVTRFLADGVEAAGNAAEQVARGDSVDAFNRAVKHGVSANLCEALSSLINVGNGLDVSVTWSRTRPTPEPRRIVKFTREEGEVLKEAARVLRMQEPRLDEDLQGYIVAAGRSLAQVDGQVTLKTFVDGKPVSVKTKVPAETYSLALTAHDEKVAVSITGDLRREGQRWRLDNPRNLALIPDEATPT